MIYFTLNTSKLFFGEIIAILIPKNDQIFIYIFRRILFHFLLESNFVVPINFEITPNFLHFPQSIVKIVVKPFPNLQIAGKFDEIKTLPEILKEGFEIYENAKNEKALGICGTQKYFEVLEEAKLKSLLKRIYSSEVPLPVNILTNAKKKVVIEIQNDAMRICVMAKINGKQSEIIFQYPDNEQFIPMYISFLRKTVIIGKKAIEDYKTHPKFVIFDILKLVGKNLQNPPKINPKWHFQLVPLNAANHAKLGIKVQTFNGFKIFPVEIIFAILLKFLLKDIAAEYFQTTEFTLRFLQYKFTASEKNVFWAAAKLLNLSMILNCEN
uniref:Uncharacterized protein n=1 Tax=Panagrolaimus sp. ES5 TaxID=591445 RepID=A0AC34FEV6_9BILA